METIELTVITDLETPANVLHGAHLECQENAPFVTMVCGLAADWSEYAPGSTKPNCPSCFSDPIHCPMCGVKLLPY